MNEFIEKFKSTDDKLELIHLMDELSTSYEEIVYKEFENRLIEESKNGDDNFEIEMKIFAEFIRSLRIDSTEYLESRFGRFKDAILGVEFFDTILSELKDAPFDIFQSLKDDLREFSGMRSIEYKNVDDTVAVDMRRAYLTALDIYNNLYEESVMDMMKIVEILNEKFEK